MKIQNTILLLLLMRPLTLLPQPTSEEKQQSIPPERSCVISIITDQLATDDTSPNQPTDPQLEAILDKALQELEEEHRNALLDSVLTDPNTTTQDTASPPWEGARTFDIDIVIDKNGILHDIHDTDRDNDARNTQKQ